MVFTLHAVLLLVLAGAICVIGDEQQYAKAFFLETFSPGWEQRWQYTNVKKYKGRFNNIKQEALQDEAIQAPTADVHYGLTALFDETLHPRDGLVLQYEVRFSQGHTCGGAYLKLLSAPLPGQTLDTKQLSADTPYSIMFGPDRCGPDSRVHVILHTRNPVTHAMQEHHLMTAPLPKGDKLSHLYSLVLSNNRYKVLIDGFDRGSGLLTTADFSVSLQPPESIPDSNDLKPEDWVEEEMMDDPDAVKPDDWDSRRVIPDPTAVKPDGWLEHQPPRLPDPLAQRPADWDDTEQGPWQPQTIDNPACEFADGCGAWTPPMIRNPNYKGPWIPPQVKNPAYKGPWKQRMIPNPDYYKVENVLDLMAPVAGVAFELWTTDTGYTFDGVLVGQGEQGLDAAKTYLNKIWRPRHKAEYAAALRLGRPHGWRHMAANLLVDIADSSLLDAFKPQTKPWRDAIQQRPEVAWGVLTTPLVMGLAGVVGWLFRAQACAAAAQQNDDTTDQVQEEFQVDDDWEAEQKKVSRQVAATVKQRNSTPKETIADASAAVSSGTDGQPPRASSDSEIAQQERSRRRLPSAAAVTPASKAEKHHQDSVLQAVSTPRTTRSMSKRNV